MIPSFKFTYKCLLKLNKISNFILSHFGVFCQELFLDFYNLLLLISLKKWQWFISAKLDEIKNGRQSVGSRGVTKLPQPSELEKAHLKRLAPVWMSAINTRLSVSKLVTFFVDRDSRIVKKLNRHVILSEW